MNGIPIAGALPITASGSPADRVAALFDTHHDRLYRLARRLGGSTDGEIPHQRSGDDQRRLHARRRRPDRTGHESEPVTARISRSRDAVHFAKDAFARGRSEMYRVTRAVDYTARFPYRYNERMSASDEMKPAGVKLTGA